MKYIKINKKTDKYLPLDGAGIIYPFVANENWNSSFRVTVRLKAPVDADALQASVDEMQREHPYFFSYIAKSGAMLYLVQSSKRLKIQKYNGVFCGPFDLSKDEPLIRVLYDENEFSFEVFHSITDGRGGIEFFKTLIGKYRQRVVESAESAEDIASSDISLDSLDDVFEKLYKNGGKSINRILPSSPRVGKDRPRVALNNTQIDVNSDELRKAAKGMNTSVTSLLCALMFKVVNEIEKPKGGKMRISIPVDIRGIFGLNTGRNSSLYITPEVDAAGSMETEELLPAIKTQFTEGLSKENIQNMIFTNVKQANMAIFKILPIPLKRFALNFGYRFLGENQFSTAITNIGIVKLPTGFEDIVEDFNIVLGETKVCHLNLTVCTYNGATRINVSAVIDGKDYAAKLVELLDENMISAQLAAQA